MASVTDYSTFKVPELKDKLKERKLPFTGNKAELIARLEASDKETSGAPAEDEIDWDDDEAAAPAPAVTATEAKSEAPATAAAPANNEAALATAEEAKEVESAKPAPIETADETKAQEPQAEDAPKPDFSAHLPASTADDEAKKRAERAKRFGIVENEEDKKLADRAKRFGAEAAPAAIKGLDEALPERRPKRGREGVAAEGDRGAKRQSTDGNRGRGGRGRRGGAGRNGDARPNGGGAPRKTGGGLMDDPAEKAKAEARAKRFMSN